MVDALVWRIGHEGGPAYEVEAGFVFDVSIPWAFRWLFNPHRQDFLKASALHDHMLKAGWSRVEAAGPFHQALLADKVSRWRRLSMFLAVALFRFR